MTIFVPTRIERISELSNISKEIKEYKKSQENDLIKAVSDPIKSFSDPIKERLYQAVLKDGALNYAEYAAIIGASEATVKRRLGELKKVISTTKAPSAIGPYSQAIQVCRSRPCCVSSSYSISR